MNASAAGNFSVAGHRRPHQSRWTAVVAVLTALTSTHAVEAQTQADYQHAQRLGSQFEQLDRAGRWQEAHQAAKQYLEFAQQRQLLPEVQLSGYESVARSLQHLGKFREALAYYDEVIQRADQIRASNDAFRTMVLIMKGNAFRFAGGCHDRLGETQKAIAMYQQSVAFFDEQGLTIEAAEARTNLGWALHSRARGPEAIDTFNAAIKVLEPAARRNDSPEHIHDNLANALMGLSTIHQSAGRYDLAEPAGRQALNVILSVRGSNNPRSAALMASLARIYIWQGRYSEAEPLLAAALETYNKTTGLKHVDALKMLNNLGRLLAVQQRFDLAEQFVQAVVEQRRATNDPELSLSLVNLANIFQAQHNYDAAAPLAREALSVAEQRYGPNSMSAAEALRLLASVHFQQNDYQQALDLSGRVTDIYEHLPVPSGYSGQLWTLRAMCLRRLNRNAEAQDAMQKAIAMAELQRGYTGGTDHERAVTFGEFSNIYDELLSWRAEENNSDEVFATIET
jgi:tetratricopeptide (TPR) repeat protein